MAITMPGSSHVRSPHERGSALAGMPFVPVLVLLVTATCTGEPDSRRVADRFMELYYAHSDVAEAAKLSSGAARAKLEGELAAIGRMAPDAPADRPRVTFHVTSAVAAGNQATYVYAVDPQTSDVKPLAVTLVMAGDRGLWLVTTLEEAERGS